MIQEGAPAPSFRVQDANGNEITLDDFQGEGAIVYFYPRDNTPGCTTEAKDFSSLRGTFAELGYRVFGVSADSVKSHCNFREKHRLTIDLLSDPDKTMLRDWGAWGEKKNYGRVYEGIIRSTVVLDAGGVVRKHYKNVKAKGHAERVLRELQAG